MAQTVAACNGNRCKLDDFIPKFTEQEKTQDWRKVKAYFMMRAAEDRRRAKQHNRQSQSAPDC